MTDEEILLLANGTFTTAGSSAEFIGFARAIEQRTLIKQKSKWYLLGAEDERRACAKIADAEIDQWESKDICAILRQVAAEIRARGE